MSQPDLKKHRIFRLFKRIEPDQIQALRHENLKLIRENRRLGKRVNSLGEELGILRQEFKRLQLIVKDYQQMLFKKKALKAFKKDKDDDNDKYTGPKKQGAPKGHPGNTRNTPKRVDEQKDVHLFECPECLGKRLSRCKRYEDHYQEDIIIPKTKVTLFRHHYYYCHDCKKVVHGTGEGELPASYIGPNAKSLAAFLRYYMALPYRKIRLLFKEMFNMEITPSACAGFDNQLRIRGQPLYNKLKDNLNQRPYLHVDETGWRDKWLWCYADPTQAVYRIEPGRGQKELSSVLGGSYKGVLISDLLGAYNGIEARKQRCLVHVLRLIDKWHTYYDYDTEMKRYFQNLKKIVKEIVRLSGTMRRRKPKNFSLKKADIVGQLRRLLNKDLESPRADKFRRKLLDHFDELITCLDYAEICAHNNFAERLLRGNVIMRKITFGNRSPKGILNHEVLMSLIQTARLREINPLPLLYTTLTNSPKAASIINIA